MIRRLLSSLNFAVAVLALPVGLAAVYAAAPSRPDMPQPVTNSVTWFAPVPLMDIPVVPATPDVPVVPVVQVVAPEAGCVDHATPGAQLDMPLPGVVRYQNWIHTVVEYRQAGPRGAVAVVGDSLTWESAVETAASLVLAGWGPVCVDALPGRDTVNSGGAGVVAIERIRASHGVWAAPSVRWVIALGTNDTHQVGADTVEAVRRIDAVVAAVGSVQQRVVWMNVATLRPGTSPAEEALFNAVVATDGRVHLLDWAGRLQLDWIREDLVHLSTSGVGGRSALIAWHLDGRLTEG